MKIDCWSVGKGHEKYVKAGIEEFTTRLQHYFKTDWTILPSPKSTALLSESDLRRKEADTILGFLEKDDYLILLDEKGKSLTSEALAALLQTRANERTKKLVFLIGGAYGVDESIKKRAQFIWSLSSLVFPHQLVRLMLAEQLYRACTILRNEKYHHR